MKKFITRLILFFIPIVLFIVSLEVISMNIPNDYSYKKNYLDHHASEIEILVLGSSHSYYGINPNYFTLNTFNASQLSQTLDYDYIVLNKYKKKLSTLKYIILPISYFSLFSQLKTQDNYWRTKFYNLYFGTLRNLKMYQFEFRKPFVDLKKMYEDYYLYNVDKIHCSTLGYGKNQKEGVQKDLNVTGETAAARHTIPIKSSYLNENTESLKDIISECRLKGIRVILYTPPAWITYRKNLNQKQLLLRCRPS